MILSWPPHIKAGSSTRQLQLRKELALAPLVAAGLYYHRLDFLWVLLATAIAGLAASLILKRIRPTAVRWERALGHSLMIALLLPAGYHWQAAWAWAALAVGLEWLLCERDMLPPVNPVAAAMAAMLLLNVGYATAMAPAGSAWMAPSGLSMIADIGPAMLAALLALALLGSRLKVRLALLYISIAIVLYIILSGGPPSPALASGLLFSAVLLAPDDPSSPRPAWGQAAYGAMAGVLFALFAARGTAMAAIVWPVLVASLFTPWLDHVLSYRTLRA